MSDRQTPPVYIFDSSDPDMQQAHEHARATFRYFWREIAWDRRRIVPSLTLACVKAPFGDANAPPAREGVPQVEHMWLTDVDWDGQCVRGVVANSPNWIESIREGDAASFPVDQISDWMYVLSGEVYGAFTVNLLRFRMSPQERQQHDQAWGLDFGDPGKIRVTDEKAHELLSQNMANVLREQLPKNPSLLSAKGFNGWTLLHQDASSGSVLTVQTLLEAGADPNAKSDNGMTPGQLAEALGWDAVVELLAGRKS